MEGGGNGRGEGRGRGGGRREARRQYVVGSERGGGEEWRGREGER